MVASTVHSFAITAAFKSVTLSTVFSALSAMVVSTAVIVIDPEEFESAGEVSCSSRLVLVTSRRVDILFVCSRQEQMVALAVALTKWHIGCECESAIPDGPKLEQSEEK